MNPAQTQRYFKIGEAAKLLGLSQETLRRWEKAGKITFSRTPGGKRLFSEADLVSIRHLLEPTHALPAGRQEPQQTSTYQSPSLSARQSERITLSISVPKLRFPKVNFTKIAITALVLTLVAGNIFLFSKTSYSQKAVEIAETQVLGVKDFIAPALEESAPIGNFISKAGGVFNKLKGKSFVIPIIGKSELATDGNLKVSGSASIAKDLKVDGTAIVGRLKTGIVDPYLIENDGLVQSSLEIRTLPSSLGSSDIVFEPGGVEELRIKEGGTVKFSGSIEGIENITATGEIKAGSLSIGGNTLSSTKLTFSGSSPSIYPSTTNTGISINGNGTGAINIGNSGTGDVYIAGGSGDSGCTITNSNGSLNCSSNITSQADIDIRGGDLTTNQTTFSLINTTATRLNIGGAATTISIGASTGTTTVNNAATITGAASLSSTLSVTGVSTFTGNLTVNGRPTITRAPTSAHTGTFTIDSSTWNVSDATIYINPASATADSNLLGVAVNGNVKFDVDAEGDVFARNLVLTGNTTTGTTTVSGDLSVEGNTTLGDATTDTFTVNTATITLAGGNKTIDITGAATRTLTLLNSTASQVANLDLSDGSLTTAGTSRLTNAGVLENITGFTQSSGNFSISGTGTFGTGTGAISLNGAITASSTLAVTGNTTLTGDLAVNGGDITTTATTLNIDVGNTGSILLRDGTNTLLTIADAGTVGNVTVSGTLTSTGAFTASAGLTLSTGALSLTGTSGSIALTGFGTTAITSTTASGDILAVTDTSLTTASANLVNFTFKNANTGAGVAVSGVTITEQAAGTPSSGTNTSNLLNLAAAAGGTVNGINISSATGFTNFIKTPSAVLDSSGNLSGVVTLTATTLAGTLSTAAQANVTSVGTLTSLAVTGNVNSASGALQTNGVTRVDNSGNITGGTGSFGGAVSPSLDATYDFGTASLRWNNAFFAGDVTAGDLVFKNNFRFTEDGDKGINILNPKGEVIGGFDDQGNLWMKGEIKQHGTGN